MEDTVRRDILKVLYKSLELLENNNFSDMQMLSDQIIHNASIYQDEDSIGVATMIYALSKILEKEKIKRYHPKEYNKLLADSKVNIKQMIRTAEDFNFEEFEKYLKNILNTINALDKSYNEYIEWVINHAKLKKARKIYEHGVSLGRVSQLLGVPEWEVMRYTAETRFFERGELKTLNPKKRLENTKKIFEGHK